MVVEVGEDERPQPVYLDGDQPEVRLVEVLGALHLARDLQAPVESVDPAVIAALQRFPVAASRHDLGGAMAAHVVEATQAAVLGMREEDRLVEDGGWLEVTVAGELARVGDQLPRAREDPLLLLV